ncbi:MAG TPA: GxxExxY protein [Tepidisphaeraceae bacterium]|nr:GxxExxY protein [Tepidisphaeraceae bacterium]
MAFDDEPTPYNDLVEPPAELDELARTVIGAAIEVHRRLGPGLTEDAYECAMAVELTLRRVPFVRQKWVDIVYKDVVVAKGRIDLLVGDRLIVEIKSVEALLPVHRMQVVTYMNMIGEPLALLINFNVPLLKEGIRRVIARKPN